MFNFRPGFIPSKFVIIGAGGTGGRLAPLLIQFLKAANWLHDPKVYIIDHDKVEDKNLIRQNFIKLDLGRPKAQVLAERYGRAFDIDVIPVVRKVDPLLRSGAGFYLTTDDAVTSRGIRLHDMTNAIVFMCVDSMEARKAILSHFAKNVGAPNILVIDAGNENDYGQVLLYTPVNLTAAGQYSKPSSMTSISLENDILPIDVNIQVMPMPTQFYLETKDRVATASCAELDQTLAINALMATSMMGIAQNFLYSKPIQFNRLNVSLSNGAIPDYFSYKQFRESIHDSYDMNGYSTRLAGELGNYIQAYDATAVIEEIKKKMMNFRTKQLNGLNAPPPLTEITKGKKKAVKELA
jgi:hypothetical protein